jgi:hypothetical protein
MNDARSFTERRNVEAETHRSAEMATLRWAQPAFSSPWARATCAQSAEPPAAKADNCQLSRRKPTHVGECHII